MAKKDKVEIQMIPKGLPEVWLWKAYVAYDPSKVEELKVDVSGDDFSLNPVDAIRYAYQSMGDRMMDLIGAGFLDLIVGGERVEVKEHEKSFTENKIILIAEKFNDSREFEKCLLGGDPEKDLSIVVALKHCEDHINGMEVHMAEYDVRDLKAESRSIKLGPDNVAIIGYRAEYHGDRDPDSIFPAEISFKAKFKNKDLPLSAIGCPVPDRKPKKDVTSEDLAEAETAEAEAEAEITGDVTVEQF